MNIDAEVNGLNPARVTVKEPSNTDPIEAIDDNVVSVHTMGGVV